MKKVVEVSKRTFGEEHSETLDYMHNLAITYSEVDQRQKAMELMEKVVKVRRRTLGEEHPHTVQSRNVIAKINNPPRIAKKKKRGYVRES